jgi:hypothetical protein
MRDLTKVLRAMTNIRSQTRFAAGDWLGDRADGARRGDAAGRADGRDQLGTTQRTVTHH